MSLELVREAIKVNQVIGEDSMQTVVENDIIVPDIKPDIARVLLLDGDVYVNSAEAVQDKILVNGTIHYNILYVSDEPEQPIKSINASAGFSCGLDVPNSRAGMKCKVKCDTEHVEYEILNGRKVNIKAIIKLSGKVINELEQGFVYDLSGANNIQTLKKHFKVNNYLGRGENDAKISEVMEIPASKPAIREILRNDAKISGKDYKITDNKVIVKGELNISTLYIGDDETGSIQFMEHEIPFAQSIDLPGITEDAGCELDYRIKDSLFEAEEDSDGELRALKAEVALYISADGFEKRDIEVIEDTYSPGDRIELEKEQLNVEEYITESKSQIVIKEIIAMDEYSPEIAEVYNVLCKPALSQYKIENDRVLVEGVISNKVLYLANNSDQPVFCHEQEIPMNQAIDIKGIKPDMGCDVDLDIEHCNYSMISVKEVEIRLVIGVTAKVVKQVPIPLIKKVNEIPLDMAVLASQPSLTIYFVQPGDTLWSIAKRYYTTIDDITRINGLDDADTINPGQQIIIPKKRV